MNTKKNKKLFSIFCWNIGNPSIERAAKQAEWLRKRQEDVFVLTELKNSKGCIFLESYFRNYGYKVISTRPEGKEYGTMIVSNHSTSESDFSSNINYLPARVSSVKIQHHQSEIEIIGVYVPSRDASPEKIKRKKRFLEELKNILDKTNIKANRIFCGDLNIIEPNHIPKYSFFKDWEYGIYKSINNFGLKDVFRHLNPALQEYSWVGRTGDGYRYDHCFATTDLIKSVKSCTYFHEPRINRLSDHSALITEFSI